MLSTIASYKDRGNFGNAGYRGNCSGYLIKDVLNHFKPQFVTDFMRGSNTSGDVCKLLNIKHDTRDLNTGFDLVNDDINIRYDFNFWHPPYWDIIKYSGYMYNKNKGPLKNDLSHIKDYNEFIRVLNYCLAKQFGSLKTGGRMAVLMGDIKKKGRLYSMLLDIQKLGTVEQIIIKEQHNVWSDNVSYNGKFIPIQHEYLLILRKDNPFLYNIKITKDIEIDIRDSEKITWKDVVAAALEKLNGKASLNQIYDILYQHKKAKNNAHWKEKIRQTLQLYKNIFKNVEKGIWSFA